MNASLGIFTWLRADWGDLERERIKEEKLIKNTKGGMREVDEEHMLIHRDNSEERGRAASPLVTGTVDEAQSECQMAVIWGSLSPLSASRGTSTLTSITTTCTSCFWSDNGALPAWPLGFHGEQHRASCTVSLILLPTPIREERVHYIWTNLWSNTAIP